MKKFCVAFIVTVLSGATLLLAQGRGPNGPNRSSAAKYAPDRLLVRFRTGIQKSSMEAAHAEQRAEVVRAYRVVENLQLVRLPAGTRLEEAIRAYRENPAVLYAEPDYIYHADQSPVTPNDPRYGELWGLNNTGQTGGTADADIDAPEAWAITTGSSNVVVAIIDTGIDYNHEDLSANMFRNTADCNSNGVDDDGNGFVDDCYGIDAINGDSDPMDDNQHGTHVAGTIGAAGNNGIGVVGVNWQVKLIACKFLGAGGSGPISAAVTCMDYLATMKDRGVNIVATNNSWGGGFFSQAEFDAINAHRRSGILFIAAAGNNAADSDTSEHFPANYYLPNIIAVASTTRSDSLSSFSNYGRHSVHLGAPGSSILSTTPGNTYSTLSGTSMATPHVTGVAALLKAQDPTRDWKAIKNLLLTGGDVIPSLANTISQKRLNARGAMTCSNSILFSRLAPRASIVTFALGGPVVPIDLAALNINCATPNGRLDATVNPGGQTLTLLDDGLGTDQEAGDGIYSAQWVPSTTSLGNLRLTFPNNDTVSVQVLSPYRFSFTGSVYRHISGSSLNMSNNSYRPITSPFPILFGGGSFDNLLVNSNGAVSFDSGFLQVPNTSIPYPYSFASPSTLIAPFWTDLVPIPDTAQNVFWEVLGTAPNRELVIEWRDLPHFACADATATVKFQVVFFEGRSDVLFNYADITLAAPCDYLALGATVGMLIAKGVGEQFGPQRPTEGSSVLWELGHPMPYLNSLSPFTALAGDAGFDLNVTGANFVPSSVVRWGGSDRPTTFIDSLRLTAAISAADIAGGGAIQVSVFNPPVAGVGGGASNDQPFNVYTSYPVPVISTVFTSLPILAGTDTAVGVSGSNFVTGSVLRFNGTDCPTQVLNAGLLTATISASVLPTAGTGSAEITVINPGPGGGVSNVLTVPVENPVPVIWGASPQFVQAGGPAFTLDVSGYQFVSDSEVRWNGSPRPTTYVSMFQLNVSILASDIAQPGTAQVTVFNPTPGGGLSNALQFTIASLPTNDNFADAIRVSSLPFTHTVDTRSATSEPTDPVPCLGGIAKSVWYQVTAPDDRWLVANASSSNYRAIVSFWTGSPGSFRPVACDRSYTQFPATPGTTYYVMVTDPNTPGSGGKLVLTLTSLFLLGVEFAGAGTGRVAMNPPGMDCAGFCSSLFAPGTVVTLTATPASGSTFAGWSGDCTGTGACVVTMDAARNVTATFNLPPPPTFMLTVTKAGTGAGTVTSSPAGIDCGSTCAASFNQGTQVSLAPFVAGSSVFAGWSGDCTGTGACVVTMTTDHNVTATFNLPPTFDFPATPPASVTISAGQSAQFTLTMNPQNGTFNNSVSFSCTSGVPPLSSCSFSPPSVTPGVNPVTTTLTITTTAPRRAALRTGSQAVFASLLLLPVLAMTGVLGGGPRRRRVFGLTLLALVLIASLAACGGGGDPPQPGTPPGPYTVTVTGTSGTIARSTNVTVIVQ